jgi:hypothetical protein
MCQLEMGGVTGLHLIKKIGTTAHPQWVADSSIGVMGIFAPTLTRLRSDENMAMSAFLISRCKVRISPLYFLRLEPRVCLAHP